MLGPQLLVVFGGAGLRGYGLERHFESQKVAAICHGLSASCFCFKTRALSSFCHAFALPAWSLTSWNHEPKQMPPPISYLCHGCHLYNDITDKTHKNPQSRSARKDTYLEWELKQESRPSCLPWTGTLNSLEGFQSSPTSPDAQECSTSSDPRITNDRVGMQICKYEIYK